MRYASTEIRTQNNRQQTLDKAEQIATSYDQHQIANGKRRRETDHGKQK